MIGKLFTKVYPNTDSEWDFITIGYNSGDTSVSVTLDQSGYVNEVISDGAPNAIVKLNGVIVTAPFTIECGDVLSADFDPAPLPSNLIFEGIYEQCYNFDITANWNLTTDVNGNVAPVTDEASFIQFLTNGYYGDNDLTNIVVTHFNLESGRLTCNLFANGTALVFEEMEVSEVNGFGVVNGLEYLSFRTNDLTEFDIYELIPDTVTTFSLDDNDLTDFDPPSLPLNLNLLTIRDNKLSKFNPSINMPVTLTYLAIGDNLITTYGWTASEAWANSQPSFTSNCDVDLSGNTDTALGTTFKTILESKNCTVTT